MELFRQISGNLDGGICVTSICAMLLPNVGGNVPAEVHSKPFVELVDGLVADLDAVSKPSTHQTD